MDKKLYIIIDVREDLLYNDIFDRDLDIYKDKIEIIKESLDIGDIHIKYNDILYIFERKTVRDLVSSIHDGRYREQKARMLSIYDKYQLSYIIEEDDVISSKIYSNKWSGGILVKIDVYEKNISILLKNGQFFQRYSFNDCCVYQKISLEEKMILYSNDYYKNSESK